MTKPEWGKKRTCQHCGARFYDMKRDPIICSRCGEAHEIDSATKSRRSTTAAAGPPKPVVAPVVEESAPEAEVEEDPSALTAEDTEIEEGETDEDAMIEDPSELGEDEDDITEVMEHVEPVDDETRNR